MAAISKDDFINWKADPVTKAFFQACQERIEDAKELLSTSAGLDPLQDKYLVGHIQAYREMQFFHIEDLDNGN